MANVQPVTDAAVTYGDQRAAEASAPLEDQIESLEAANADLQQRLDDCEAGGGPTPPDDDFTCLIGASVNGPLFKGLGYSEADCTRVYLRSLPNGSTWNNIVNDGGATSDLRDGVSNLAPGGALWLSYKERDIAKADAFFDTIPEDVAETYHIVTTWYHEPEDNETSSAQKDAYRKAWKNDHGPMIRAHGMIPALCLMGYTLQSGSGRNWRDWYPGDGVVDITGWDKYRKNDAGSAGNSPSAINNMADEMEAIADETGTWGGIGETGSTSERYNEADTETFAKNWREHLLDPQYHWALAAWWDQDTFTLTAKTAKAWMGRGPTATRQSPRLGTRRS